MPATVHKQGHLDIPQTFVADLDQGAITSSGADIWFEAKTETDRYITPRGTQIATVSSTTASRDACSRASYITAPIPITSLHVGSIICVRSDQNRYSAITVTALPGPSPGTLGIDFVTWE